MRSIRADEGLCEACLFDLAAGEIGSACMGWFEDFYMKVRVVLCAAATSIARAVVAVGHGVTCYLCPVVL